MRLYETLFIVTPDSSEEELKAVSTKFQGLVSDMHGQVVKYTEQGRKKLAYDVKKHSKGFYVQMDYAGTADLVAEIERNMRLDDRVLKYITVKLEDSVDSESIAVQEPEPPKETEAAVASEPEEAQPEEAQPEEVQETEGEESEEAAAKGRKE
jgi:small subunit ribosomal protein S6